MKYCICACKNCGPSELFIADDTNQEICEVEILSCNKALELIEPNSDKPLFIYVHPAAIVYNLTVTNATITANFMRGVDLTNCKWTCKMEIENAIFSNREPTDFSKITTTETLGIFNTHITKWPNVKTKGKIVLGKVTSDIPPPVYPEVTELEVYSCQINIDLAGWTSIKKIKTLYPDLLKIKNIPDKLVIE